MSRSSLRLPRPFGNATSPGQLQYPSLVWRDMVCSLLWRQRKANASLLYQGNFKQQTLMALYRIRKYATYIHVPKLLMSSRTDPSKMTRGLRQGWKSGYAEGRGPSFIILDILRVESDIRFLVTVFEILSCTWVQN